MQYFTGLPVAPRVALHLLGAALTAAAMTWLLLGTRERTGVPVDASMWDLSHSVTGSQH